MVSIKKRNLRAYILLESLVGLALLVSLVSLVLGEFTYRQERLIRQLNQQERLNVALMCLQTQQTHLSLNGVTVEVDRTDQGIRISSQGEELLYVAKN